MEAGVFARTYTAQVPGNLFASIARDGFATTQFNLSCAGLEPLPVDVPDGLAEEISEAARSAGVGICALSGTYNMAHPDIGYLHRMRPAFRNVMGAARQMGVGLVTLCTGSRNAANMWAHHVDNTSRQAWHDLRRELDFVLALAEEFDLRLGVEPEPGNIIANAPLAHRLLGEVAHPRLGIVLDAANLLPPRVLPRQHEIVAEAVDMLGEHLFLVHAKDVDRSGVVVPAGKGAVDLPAFVTCVRSTGYDGALVGHNFAEAEAPGVARYLSTIISGKAS